MKAPFVERTLRGILSATEYAATAERMSETGGALQRVDPRVKVAGLFGLVIVVTASHHLRVIGAEFALAVLLALTSRIPIRRLAVWVWSPVLLFTGTIAFPAIFLIPGRVILALGGGIGITVPGLRSAAFLVSRAETTATFSTLLVLTTPWPWVLKALRTFRCPIVFVAILGMTYRYIFVMLETALEMIESRKSRTVGSLAPSDRRRLAASTGGVLLSKTLQLSADVHLAMQSRGYRGEVHVLDEFSATSADFGWLAAFAAIAAIALWWGR